MKIREALLNVKQENGIQPNLKRICWALDLSDLIVGFIPENEFIMYPLFEHKVLMSGYDYIDGTYSVFLHDSVVGMMENGNFYPIDEGSALYVRQYLLEFKKPITIKNEVIELTRGVLYTEYLLYDEGFYEGQPVKVKVKYSSSPRTKTTPYEERTGDRSYFISVPRNSPNWNCLDVQFEDGSIRTIPVYDFKFRLQVTVDFE